MAQKAKAVTTRPVLGSTVLINLGSAAGHSMIQFENKIGVIVNVSDLTGNSENMRFLVNLGKDPKSLHAARHLLCVESELTVIAPEGAAGTLVSIAGIRQEAQAVVDWFQHRLDHGDILLDAWMEPSLDAAKEIINQVDTLQRLGWNTVPTPGPVTRPKLFSRLLAALRG